MPPEIPDLPDDFGTDTETQADHTRQYSVVTAITLIAIGILIGLAWSDAWDAIRSIHP